MRDPSVVQPRGRPRGSENRRQQAFEAYVYPFTL